MRKLVLALGLIASPLSAQDSAWRSDVNRVLDGLDTAFSTETVAPYVMDLAHPAIVQAQADANNLSTRQLLDRVFEGYALSAEATELVSFEINRQATTFGTAGSMSWAFVTYDANLRANGRNPYGSRCHEILIFKDGGGPYLVSMSPGEGRDIAFNAIPVLQDILNAANNRC